MAEDLIFEWSGTDRAGKKVSGETRGASLASVKAILRKQGINAKSVKKQSKSLFSFGEKITPADIALFTRQLATMMKAGVPLVQSFDIVAGGVENQAMKSLIKSISSEVSGGNNFAAAVRAQPREYFDDLFCNLIDAGEQSGALETMLDRLATYKEKSEALKAKIKSAMNYPIAVLVISAIVTGILLIKVVPQFEMVFSGFGSELPAFTQMVVNASEFMQAWWLIIAGVFGGVYFAYKQAHKNSQAFRDGQERLSLKTPVVGDILNKSCIARFARTLSTTFAAGVPLVDALDSAAGASGNVVYKNAIMKIKNEVSGGTQLNHAMNQANVFPSMVIQMVAIGEESGALDSMLEKSATYYEEMVDTAVDGLTSLIEPIIMAFLGIVVGGMMIAMYLPIFKMGGAISG
jgi:type IV pilus assembly protein PilC